MPLSSLQKNMLISALIINEPVSEIELLLDMSYSRSFSRNPCTDEELKNAIKELADDGRYVRVWETTMGYKIELTPEGRKKARGLIDQSEEKYILSTLIDKTNEDKYSLYIVCYMDILGFSKTINSLKSQQLHAFINKMRLALCIANREGYTGLWPEEYKASVFSDSVIMSSPAKGNNLWGIVKQVSHFQGTLSLQELFVRGAITIGQHYEKDNIIISPALIRAYQLSEAYAIYPRVIIDNTIFSGKIKIFYENDTGFPYPNWQSSRMIRMDSDGYYFVNYLEEEVSSADSSGDGGFYLKDHKTAILKNIRRNRTNSRIIAKMKWLGELHNTLIRERQKSRFRDFSKFENEQLIDLEERSMVQ